MANPGIKFDKKGETPLDDISGLIPKITTRAELDDVEAENISDAIFKYLVELEIEDIRFDEPFLRQVHKDMLCDVWKWAGTYRTTATSIGVDANQILHKLYHLLDDLKFWTENWDYKETATRLHSELVRIHPFPNGNGRWGRLVTDMWLRVHEKETSQWGKGDIVAANGVRDEYIRSLQEAERGNYEPLKQFIFPEEYSE
jgi:Fic-DOC domain mobile mystery protein B